MAYSINDLNTLDSAIAQGATLVKYADKEVQYRSLKEMLEIRNMIRDELGLNGPDPRNKGRRYASFNKGLDSCN